VDFEWMSCIARTILAADTGHGFLHTESCAPATNSMQFPSQLLSDGPQDQRMDQILDPLRVQFGMSEVFTADKSPLGLRPTRTTDESLAAPEIGQWRRTTQRRRGLFQAVHEEVGQAIV
jgi:hypothetical protein